MANRCSFPLTSCRCWKGFYSSSYWLEPWLCPNTRNSFPLMETSAFFPAEFCSRYPLQKGALIFDHFLFSFCASRKNEHPLHFFLGMVSLLFQSAIIQGIPPLIFFYLKHRLTSGIHASWLLWRKSPADSIVNRRQGEGCDNRRCRQAIGCNIRSPFRGCHRINWNWQMFSVIRLSKPVVSAFVGPEILL